MIIKTLRNSLVLCSFVLSCLVTFGVLANSSGGGAAPAMGRANFDPVATYNKGLKYLQAEEYKKAARSFRKVLNVARKDPNSNYLLGLSYVALEENKKARKPLENALKYDASNIPARGLLGFVYLALDKPEEAEAQKQLLLDLQKNCDECAEKKNIDATDPNGPENGSVRVIRGGSWSFSASFSRSALRNLISPGGRFSGLGFRLVLPQVQ